MRKTELLIPAGSLNVLKTAVIYGADAVYIGGEAFGLRAKAHNFSLEDMKEGIAFAHAHDVKVYVTANILAHNQDLPGVEAYFEELKEVGPDALIISDPGVFAIAKRVLPHGNPHQHPGQQYKLWYLPVLAPAWRQPGGYGKGTFAGGNQGDTVPDPGGHGD